jgi:hypothetical protein
LNLLNTCTFRPRHGHESWLTSHKLEKNLSYVDALFDREHDRIHVVERRDGVRVYQEYPANYVFYYDDPRGKFTSILFGTPVSRFSTRNNKEFRKEVRIQSGKQLYERISIPYFAV